MAAVTDTTPMLRIRSPPSMTMFDGPRAGDAGTPPVSPGSGWRNPTCRIRWSAGSTSTQSMPLNVLAASATSCRRSSSVHVTDSNGSITSPPAPEK